MNSIGVKRPIKMITIYLEQQKELYAEIEKICITEQEKSKLYNVYMSNVVFALISKGIETYHANGDKF